MDLQIKLDALQHEMDFINSVKANQELLLKQREEKEKASFLMFMRMLKQQFHTTIKEFNEQVDALETEYIKINE